jgi:two-component system CheB/CheR fusion protein
MAFVLVQHLDPTHGSFMAELVGRHTSMPVVQVQADAPIVGDHVYCIPPGRYLSVSGRTLRLTAPEGAGSVRMPIDVFLRALAADVKEQAVGIVVSGTGTDGTMGLHAIRAAGGLAIAQEPATAQHDGMPRSAIAAGAVDHCASPEQMPLVLLDYLRHPYTRGAGEAPSAPAIAKDHLQAVLAIVRKRTDFDFRDYKRGTLARRIGRRMGLTHVEDVAGYVRLLTDEPDEAKALFEDLLINVTSFFRDPEVWIELRERVIRPLVARQESGVPLRVWVPGCATGEEAYSIAMLLIEELQAAHKTVSVQIFASDVDVGALEVARVGLYPETVAADVSPERRRRFFIEEAHGARIGKELRESVIFARQNLLLDPPYSGLHLISCRNVLMYFEAAAQKRLLPLLHFALLQRGSLLLGTADGIGQDEGLFEILSPKARLYRRVGQTRHDRVQLPTLAESSLTRPIDRTVDRPGAGQFSTLARQLLLDRFAPACVLINRRCEILYFAGPTHDYLQQPAGVPTWNLMSRLRNGLQTKLRAAIGDALADGRRRRVAGAHVRRGDGWHRVELTVERVRIARETEGVLLVCFVDEPRVSAVPNVVDVGEDRDEPGARELEAELRTTREDLQGTIAELEGSNQELTVANEEVMSVNEELRSSNEELETSKEELSSLNEELNTVNAQLEDSVDQLQQVNNDLDNLLTSTNIATIFLDTTLRVRRFTPVATRLFDLMAPDVGRSIGDLAQRCLDPDLPSDAEQVLAHQVPISKEVQSRDGRWYVRQALPYRTHDDRIGGVVITFSDVAAEALQEARLYAEAIVDAVRHPLLVLDPTCRVQSANRSFYETFGLTPDETVGELVFALCGHVRGAAPLPALLGEMLRSGGALANVELDHDVGTIGRRTLRLDTRTLGRRGGRPDLILLAIEDITERKRTEVILRESEAMTRAGVRTAMDGMITLDERGTILSFNPAAEQMFGYSGAEVIGQSVGMLASESDGRLRIIDPSLLGVAREVRGRRKDGSAFPLDLHVSAFDDGLHRRLVGVLRDVTDRKRTEEDGRRHQAELAHVLRIATIEHLASGLAHEINQPLAAIANEIEACATYVRAGTQEPRRLLASLEHAGAEALRAGGIVHHLREFVQRTPAHLEVTDLSAVVRNAIQWFVRETEQSRITVRLELTTTALRVCVDRIQIEQVLVNLLQNAIDAIGDAVADVREICIHTSRRDDGMAEVSIDDTGIGFHAAAAERIYEPYFTTKPQGMGMGLAISRSIVEMHHGRLSLAPRTVGGGTTVRMALPLEAIPCGSPT